MQKNCTAFSLIITLVVLIHYSLTSPTSAVSSANFGSPEALWSLLIILLHMFFGFIHMWWRGRKKTPKTT